MNVVEILEVETIQPRPDYVIACLDRPTPGEASDTFAFTIAGWVLDRRAAVQHIEMAANGRVIRLITVVVPRPDVTAAYPNVSQTVECGFHALVGVVGLNAQFTVELAAVHHDQTRTPLFRVRGRHRGVHSGIRLALRPLIVTHLGRSGSTWLMRLLAEHAGIVTPAAYPYEVRAGRYWMQALQVLTEPSNHTQSSSLDGMSSNPWWVGHQPYYASPVLNDDRVNHWFGRDYVGQVADFCVQSIESFYQTVAQSQGKSGVAYFAEKHDPDRAPELLRELYPEARELVLVRDVRDMFCSIRAFNSKRGTLEFGRSLAKDEEEYIAMLGKGAYRLFECWKSRADRAHLVRYEDLISRPLETLRELFEFLGLDREPATLAQIVRQASSDLGEFKKHGTSSKPADSVGRWQSDLDAPTKRAMEREFAEVLEAFGYDKTV